MVDIIIIQRIFSSYRKGVFNELYKELPFVLLHSNDNSDIFQEEAFYSKKVKGVWFSKKKMTHVFLFVFYKIFRLRPRVVIHEFSIGIISLLPTLILTKLLGAKFVVWGHGFDRTKGFHPSKLKDKFRIFIMRKSDAVILYSNLPREKLKKYVDKDKIFIANNTINTRDLVKIRKELEKEGAEKIKMRLKIPYKYNFIFIGRPTPEKKPDVLFDIFKKIPEKYKKDTAIHFIGNGPELNKIKTKVYLEGLKNHYYFHGAIYDYKKTGELLFISDLLILPGKVGLSLNHAFVFGCPIITFKQGIRGPFHSPEIEYLKENHNGFLIDNYSIDTMVKKIVEYISNEELQKRMKKNVLDTVSKECDVSLFIRGFKETVNYVLQKKK